jgi:hypothetical protein
LRYFSFQPDQPGEANGAGRGSLVAQFLIESLVLAEFGTLAGLALALPAMRFLERLVPEAMGAARLTLDWRNAGIFRVRRYRRCVDFSDSRPRYEGHLQRHSNGQGPFHGDAGRSFYMPGQRKTRRTALGE